MADRVQIFSKLSSKYKNSTMIREMNKISEYKIGKILNIKSDFS